MNKYTDIDDILRKLPEEKTPDDFTNKVMMRISALPQKTSFAMSRRTIILIVAAAIAIVGLGGWLVFSVLDIRFEFLYSLGDRLSIESVISSLRNIYISPTILGGLIIGALLLLVDGWFRNKVQKQQHATEIQQKLF